MALGSLLKGVLQSGIGLSEGGGKSGKRRIALNIPRTIQVSFARLARILSFQMNPCGIRLLIGEDDRIISADMSNQLSKLGYQVKVQAGTADDVVRLARELLPDLIILDLNIHGDTYGIEVAQQVRSIAMIPIVFVSAFASDMQERASVIPKPYRFVTKPFILQELELAIKELLEVKPTGMY